MGTHDGAHEKRHRHSHTPEVILFEGTRDTLIKKAIQEHPIVKRLGTIHSLSLNTNERSCDLEIGLVGEPYPIRFTAKYDILKTDTGVDFQIQKIHSEKQWMEEILKMILEAKGGSVKFSVSGMAAKLLDTFL